MSRGVSGTVTSGWGLPLLTVIIGSFMSILDSTIVNVAVPTLMAQFGASTDQVQWVVTIFLLVLGVVVPVSGWLADRFGMSRVYIAALVIFTAGSALCGMSWSLGSLIFFRLLQAVGGGLIGPITMAMVYRLVPRERIGTAMGIYGLTVAFGPALGPTLGGYLVEFVSWRLIFYINVPVGILGVLLAMTALPRMEGDAERPFDFWGFVTSALGLGTLLFVLSEGQTWGWSAEGTILLLVASAWLLALFVVIELSLPYPLLDVRIFRYRVFSLSSLLIMVTVVALYAGSFYVPLFMQTIQGQGAFATGMTLMPGALVMGALMPVSGRLYDLVGARTAAVAGLLLVSVATLLLLRLDVNTSNSSIAFWMALRYAGLGLGMMPIMTAGLSVVPTSEISRASAINNIIQRSSGSLGLAVLTAVFTQRAAERGAELATNVSYFNGPLLALSHQLYAWVGLTLQPQATPIAPYAGFMAVAQVIAARAYAGALHDIFAYATISGFIGVALAFFLRERRQAGGGRRAVAVD